MYRRWLKFQSTSGVCSTMRLLYWKEHLCIIRQSEKHHINRIINLERQTMAHRHHTIPLNITRCSIYVRKCIHLNNMYARHSVISLGISFEYRTGTLVWCRLRPFRYILPLNIERVKLSGKGRRNGGLSRGGCRW